MPRSHMNDNERRLWVLNDEGLYNWYRAVRLPIREFIRLNRAEIDTAIDKLMNRKPSWQSQHHGN